MNSIDQQQPENNRENLSGAGAIDKIKELAEGQTCFFCTQPVSGDPKGTRPMSVQQVDAAGAVWFLCADDSFTVAELNANPSVKLFFKGSSHSDFLVLEGKATLSRDKAKIEEFWQPILKTWFTKGKDDPRIVVVRVSPESGYYWDTKHGSMVAGIKMLVGAVTGQTLDDSIQGNLKP